MQFNLNSKQQQAVKHESGPLLIIAGAGTGKTAVITQRIVHLVNEGLAKPSEILALTFTEKAAAEMEARVDLEMPIGYEEIWISTFHSFCDRILRQEGVFIGLDSAYTLMSGAQSYIFFRKHLFDLPLDKFRPQGNPTKNIGDVLKHISRLQDEDIFPKEYIKYAKSLSDKTKAEKEEKANIQELAEVYKAYTELKIENSKLDFGDLIITTLQLLRNKPNILEKYRKKFKYILVDEFQDTNYTQNVLVNLLALGKEAGKASKVARNKANITVVGDDDQAIYKFRGAAISNILQFKETYPNAKSIVLTENYRSRQEILDAAYQLVQHNNPYRLEITEKIDKKLFAQRASESELLPVQLLITEKGLEEADQVAKEILRLTGNKDKLKDDSSIVDKKFDQQGQGMFVDVVDEKTIYKFSDIAILARANNHTDEFIQAFRYYGIPYKFSGPKGLYSRPEVLLLISYLRTLRNYKDDISMFNILKMEQWNLQPREVVEIMQMARSKHLSIIEMLEEMWMVKLGSYSNPNEFLSAQTSNLLKKVFTKESIVGVSSLLSQYENAFRGIKEGMNTGELLYDFFTTSGYLQSLLDEETVEAQFKIQNISKYFELIKAYENDNPGTNLYEYVDYLDYSIEIGESPKVDQDILDDYDAVNVSTVHGAKGLEFPVVFMVNLINDRFPSRNRSDVIPLSEDLIKETLSESDESTSHLHEERRLFYVGATRAKDALYLTASQFYNDGTRKRKTSIFLDELLSRKVSKIDKPAVNGHSIAPKFSVNISSYDDSLDISDLELNLGGKVSYSQISLYENCPKQYKYKYVLGLPGPANSALSFGSTIHNTLNDFYNRLTMYKEGLEGMTDKPDLTLLLELYHSRWISAGYENKKHEQIRKKYGTEVLETYFKKSFSIKENPIALEKMFSYKLDDILITGKIDRIDLVDSDKKIVELIDYKTGKVKNEKEAESDLQLALYTIVAEEYLGYKVKSACLLFIEHNVCRKVEVGVEQKNKVKDQIKQIVEQIRRKDFHASPGNICHYCDFKTICEDASI